MDQVQKLQVRTKIVFTSSPKTPLYIDLVLPLYMLKIYGCLAFDPRKFINTLLTLLSSQLHILIVISYVIGSTNRFLCNIFFVSLYLSKSSIVLVMSFFEQCFLINNNLWTSGFQLQVPVRA